MLFDLTLGIRPQSIEQSPVYRTVHSREAVRAVVWRGRELLLVQTANGDFKFPGGGINGGESHLEALQREVREETGFRIEAVGGCIGVAAERMPDQFEPGCVFAMISHYYPASVADIQESQELDEYEAMLGFRPVWIDPDQAIAVNEAILLQNRSVNRWVYRETEVLKILLVDRPASPH